MKLYKIITFNKMAADLKLDGLTGKEKYQILKIFRTFKLTESEFEDFKKDIIEKYTNNDEFKSKIEAYNNNDEEAKAWIENINKEVNEVLAIELNSDKEVEFDKLSEETFTKIIECNDLKINEMDALEEILM